MAVRDKSQRVGFVYTNIYEIYKKAQAASGNLKSDSKVWRADELQGIKISKFEPRTLSAKAPAEAPSAPNFERAAADGANAFDDLKQNIERLRNLHSRLRFMLKELEDLVEKK